MKLHLREFTEEGQDYRFTETTPWVTQALQSVDEKDERGESASRPIRAEFSARKIDEAYLVSGRVDSSIQLLCSRCGVVFFQACTPAFSVLFSQDPVMAGVVNNEAELKRKTHISRGKAYSSRNPLEANSSEDMDVSHLTEEFIDLAAVLAEQLRLQVPFQPLCKAECKGVCSTCGTDLNRGRCACDRLAQRKTPFAVLKDLKNNAR
jgi:uncharacterized protein